jgi:putative membrane protein
MLPILIHLVVTAALLLLIANLVHGVQVENWGAAFIAAIVLGLVNAFIRPLMILLTLPLTILTFGLFLLVINALMLQLAAAVVPGVRVRGFGAALVGSILLTILNMAVAAVFGV